MFKPTKMHAVSAAILSLAVPALAQVQAPTLAPVLVQGGRIEQQQFDAAASIYSLDGETIRSGGPQVNLSDALSRVPGVVSLNRNNYAQDVQISIRGFGSRAAFGLRGIRLITDGIPATTPDGQGQASTVSLTSTDRIEVLSGPLAQLYGNAAGGVIQTFTREAGARPEGEMQLWTGSYGLQRSDWQASGRSGAVGIVADYSTFAIDSYRDNSAAKRTQFNSVITYDASPDTRFKLIANVFDMPEAKDPLGLTQAQLANPSSAGTNAVARSTRKIVSQEQAGATVEHRFSADLRMQGRLYGGNRENLQFQTSGTTGSWVGLDRNFHGAGLQLNGKQRMNASMAFDWVLGMDKDNSGERRQGGAAALGQKTGGVTRNEMNWASNQDYFGQINWHLGERWSLTTGVRQSTVRLKSQDDYLADAKDGSGSVKYSATSPVLGLTWHASDTLNLYINQGRGFETPTLAEAAYTNVSGAIQPLFNPNLRASTSRHLEVGSKWAISPSSRLDVAVFQIKTADEIVVDLSVSGQSAFRNATETQRQGLELAWRQQLSSQWRTVASATVMNATYERAFGTVSAGKQLPGVPARQLFASVQWARQGFAAVGQKPVLGPQASLDWLARSSVWANDTNTAQAAGYGLLNAKVRQRYQVGSARLDVFAGIDNLANRRTVGSVIVNQASSQFFEPGLPRNWTAGMQFQQPF